MAEGQSGFSLRNEPEMIGENQRRLTAALAGGVQIWEAYATIVAQSSPEIIRQVTNRVVDQLNQLQDQLGQQSHRQQLGGSNR